MAMKRLRRSWALALVLVLAFDPRNRAGRRWPTRPVAAVRASSPAATSCRAGAASRRQSSAKAFGKPFFVGTFPRRRPSSPQAGPPRSQSRTGHFAIFTVIRSARDHPVLNPIWAMNPIKDFAPVTALSP